MSRLALALVAALLGASLTAEARRGLDPAVISAEQDIANWRIDVAAWKADRLLARAPDDPSALLLAARVAFYQSDYERARELAARSAAAAPEGSEAREDAASLVQWIEERLPTWSTFTEHRTDHFVLRVTPRDRILVPYAARALEASAAAIGADLGWCPSEPVVVEIYPSRRTFIAASTLSQEEVETSGTVAICHFNRLMVISPSVMERGYEWLDTLCHEYVHYVVYHLAGEDVPVWLHEGIAKTLESRWRREGLEALDPRLSTVLAEGTDTGRWVTFDEMSPSMAKLPSAGLVTLAFAQVSAGVRMMIEGPGGLASVRDVLGALPRHGGDVDAALREVTGDGLDDFERRVRAHVSGLDLHRIPGAAFLDEEQDSPLRPAFKDEDAGESDPEADARTLQDRKARDWVLLGDRLKGRGFDEAALIEYEKALVRLQESQPLVVNRKARALIALERKDEARATLERTLAHHPGLAVTLDNLAEVHVRLARAASRPAEARAHEERALAYARLSEDVNPFAPDTHVRLAGILSRLGRTAEAEESRGRLELLRSTP